jgi:hypothetical protein
MAHCRHKPDAHALPLPAFGQLLHGGNGTDDSHGGKVVKPAATINLIVGSC